MKCHCSFLSWWTFRIFLIFFCSEGGVRGAGTGGGGGRIFIESPRRGGGCPGRVRAGRVSVGNLGGGGLNIFFGAELPIKLCTIHTGGEFSKLAGEHADKCLCEEFHCRWSCDVWRNGCVKSLGF